MTNAQEKPEWLEDWKQDEASQKSGNPAWKKGMKSPNPSGRPRGIVDKRTRVTQALMDDAQNVVRVVIDAALEGDIQAASLILSRVSPAIKAQAEKVSFNFDANAPMTTQVEQVLLAISGGEVSPDTGKQIIESISALAGIKQIDELEARLNALESK